MVNLFWQSIAAILDNFIETEKLVWYHIINSKTIIFQYSKINGNPHV